MIETRHPRDPAAMAAILGLPATSYVGEPNRLWNLMERVAASVAILTIMLVSGVVLGTERP